MAAGAIKIGWRQTCLNGNKAYDCTMNHIWLNEMIRRIFAPLVAATLMLAASPVAAEDRVIDKLATLSGTVHIDHASPLLGRNLQIFIKASPLIDPEGDPPPIIYVLDAEQAFPLLSAYSWSLTFSEEMPPSIIVGIGYGTSNPSINMRNRDYTAPGSNPQYGGADLFMDVLENEIFPRVEALSGGDPTRRILVGQSLGGQFVVHAALNKPGLVDLGIAINPALHNNLPLFREMLAMSEGETRLQSLYISSAEQDADRYRLPARLFIAEADTKESLPFCLKTDILEDHTHLSSMPRAFRNGIRWHYGDRVNCEIEKSSS